MAKVFVVEIVSGVARMIAREESTPAFAGETGEIFTDARDASRAASKSNIERSAMATELMNEMLALRGGYIPEIVLTNIHDTATYECRHNALMASDVTDEKKEKNAKRFTENREEIMQEVRDQMKNLT